MVIIQDLSFSALCTTISQDLKEVDGREDTQRSGEEIECEKGQRSSKVEGPGNT